jgi:hypothetical protein
MPHAIDDDDWPLFRRLMQDYKSGRLTKKRKTEATPRRGGGRGLKLGRTVDPIEQGKVGKIVKLQGKQGAEQPVGAPFDAFNRFGDLAADQDLLYQHIGRGFEVVQSWCAENEDSAGDDS